MNAQGALLFVVETILSLYILTYLVRFFAQLVRANFYNPLMQAIVNITNPVVRPLRRIIPGWGGADLATLFAAIFFQVAMIALLVFIQGGQLEPLALIVASVRRLIDTTLMLFFFLILFGVLMSWLQPDPRNPFVALINQFIDPILRPVRRVIPPVGGLDFSPFIVLIGLQTIRILIQ